MAKTSKKADSGRLTTGEFRMSFGYLFAKRNGQDGQEGKYGLTMLFKKSDKKSIEQLEKLAFAALEASDKFDAKQKSAIWKEAKAKLFRDGNQFEYDGYAGMIAVNCANSRKPTVVGPDLQPVIDREEVYSGCYGRAAIRAFAYNNKSKGVAFSLDGFQKTRDGEPFGSTFKAEEAFDAVDPEEF